MAKKKRISKKQMQIQQQKRKEIINYIISLLVIAVIVIAVFSLGQAGDYLNNFLKNIFGDIPFYLVMFQIILYCFYILYNGKSLNLTSRYIIGALFINIGTMVMFGCIDSPAAGFAALNNQNINNLPIGYLQMLFFGIFSNFGGYYGAGLIAFIFIIIGIIIYYMVSVSEVLKNRTAKINERTIKIKDNIAERKEIKEQNKENNKQSNILEQNNIENKKPKKIFNFNKESKFEKINTIPSNEVKVKKSKHKIIDFFKNDDTTPKQINNETDNKQDINDQLQYGSIIDEITNSSGNNTSDSNTSIFNDDNQISDIEIAEKDIASIPFEVDDLDILKIAQSKLLTQDKLLKQDNITNINQEQTINEKVQEIKIKKKLKNDEKKYKLPSFDLLSNPMTSDAVSINKKYATQQSQSLMDFLKTYKINARVSNIIIGPSVTKFELALNAGIRVNRISNMYDDIKMVLAVKELRIEAPIPGKALVGIEIPNVKNNIVTLKEVLNDIDYNKENKLVFGIGKDINGKSIYASMDKMPHLLIAGSTGAGKSVMINSVIVSLLMNASYNDLKLLLIDPKQVELAIYNDIPHLLTPVVNDPKAASVALKKVVVEMENRYKLMSSTNTRKIEDYNKHVESFNKTCADESLHMNKMPYIVVIIDELADLMLVSKNEVEESIMRITQLARAAGIHLIVATQRPSTDIITGVIKNNLPSRIAFAVSSSIDSRTILGTGGAESLLGKGDMLYAPAGHLGGPSRVQGAYLSDEEITKVVFAIKKQGIPQIENEIFTNLSDTSQTENGSQDDMYDEIEDFVKRQETVSTSKIQREFRIGYNRAANLIDDLERNGIISEQRGSKPRHVLIQNQELEWKDEK
ncbi:DNA translocase FtsK [Mycoplasma sp. P36-A1]|uniref:DNA translocase FtsK n=1 Tax=Mycoplasma sp. P36-A1 TaxID=3252900 RepID=UPI003C2B8A6F